MGVSERERIRTSNQWLKRTETRKRSSHPRAYRFNPSPLDTGSRKSLGRLLKSCQQIVIQCTCLPNAEYFFFRQDCLDCNN